MIAAANPGILHDAFLIIFNQVGSQNFIDKKWWLQTGLVKPSITTCDGMCILFQNYAEAHSGIAQALYGYFILLFMKEK